MAKFLLFVAVIAIAYVAARHARRRRNPARDRSVPPRSAPPNVVEDMTRCAHCGIHVPRSEAVRDEAGDFCCAEHRRLGSRR